MNTVVDISVFPDPWVLDVKSVNTEYVIRLHHVHKKFEIAVFLLLSFTDVVHDFLLKSFQNASS